MIKARIYDEAVAKTGGVTALKLIHICVDYSAKMETILAEMRVLFDTRNRFFRGSPVPLEKFPDLPPTEVLQNLQTPPTLRTNQESVEFGPRVKCHDIRGRKATTRSANTYPRSNANSRGPRSGSDGHLRDSTPLCGSCSSRTISTGCLPHASESEALDLLLCSTSVGNNKGIYGVREKASGLHTYSRVSGIIEPIAGYHTCFTTMKPIPTSSVGLRDLASTARTSTAMSTPYPSDAQESAPSSTTPTTGSIFSRGTSSKTEDEADNSTD